MQSIKNLKQQIEYCLEHYPETRNSDIELTIKVWKEFYNKYIIYMGGSLDQIRVRDLFKLPREDNIKRLRAHIQNYEIQFIPTDWNIAKKRGWLKDKWKQALGYSTIPPEQNTLIDVPHRNYN